MQGNAQSIQIVSDLRTFSFSDVAHHFRILRFGLRQLDRLCAHYKDMQAELETFLTRYHARIAPLCEKRERLLAQLSPCAAKEDSGVDNDDTLTKPSDTDRRMKHLYRKLVKECHPDRERFCPPPHYSAHHVITAYEEKSLGTLWLMDAERECRAMTDTVSIIRYLKCECDEVAKAVNQLRQRKQALMESADWQLKERVFDAAQSGGDLIRIIEQNIQSQIEAAQAQLAHRQRQNDFAALHKGRVVAA